MLLLWSGFNQNWKGRYILLNSLKSKFMKTNPVAPNNYRLPERNLGKKRASVFFKVFFSNTPQTMT